MFRRSNVRYGDTPPAKAVPMAARQIWDGRIGSAVVQAKNWRLAFFTTLSLCGGMAAGWFWQSERGTVVPWVVQVDKLGNVASGQARPPPTYHPTDPIIARDLANFINGCAQHLDRQLGRARRTGSTPTNIFTDKGKLASTIMHSTTIPSPRSARNKSPSK